MERQLLDSLEQIREGVQIIGFDWRYLFLNRAAAEHGRRTLEELLGRTMMECYPGIDQTPLFAHLTRCMEERVALNLDNPFTYPDGSTGWFELHIEPVRDGILILSLDVSDRKDLEARLRQTQKMDAIGRLAGGIAHDFNNLLTIMNAAGEFALESLDEAHPAHADVSEMLRAATRATKLVAQLLAFSRRQPISPRVLDPRALLDSMGSLLGSALGERVTLEIDAEPALWPVRVDPDAFEQVVMNLAVNARDAMPTGGRLRIGLRNRVLEAASPLAARGALPSGEYVAIEVEDDGVGMSDHTLERLFEPFFTTKAKGAGTGLGLSTCFGIVKQLGGHIAARSELGRGTTFEVLLPRATGPVQALQAPSAAVVRGGHETILVVEDDPDVRLQTCRVLKQAGYRTLEAGDLAGALAICASETAAIQLLLSDVIMPGANGPEVAAQVRQACPGIKVVFMSGYSEDALVHQGVVAPGVRLVLKPFTPASLTGALRAALDER